MSKTAGKRRSRKRSRSKSKKSSKAVIRKKKEPADVVIMVDMNPTGSWTYPASLFPAHWYWDGGDTALFAQKRPRYVRTEWFMGRSKTLTTMKKRLKEYFNKLKKTNKVSSYRITSKPRELD